MTTVYLDHSASSPMERSTLEAMWPYLNEHFANASSQHEAGKLAAAGLTAAREVIADVLQVAPQEVLFTSGGTESDNLALKGVALEHPRGRQVITSVIEHEAILESCSYLQRHHGFRISQIGVDHAGRVDLEHLQAELSDQTTLCSIHYANNEVGTVQDVQRISELCARTTTTFHVDAVQAGGLLDCRPQHIGAALVSLSGHKFGGPKGTGVLIKRSGIYLEPLLHGGGHEFGLRSGTSNVAGAVGLAAALHTSEAQRLQRTATLRTLRDRLIEGVTHAWPNTLVTGSREHRLPNHASFCFPGVSGESVLLDLEARGIACSSGSACAAGSAETSPVLRAMGYTDELARTAVRFSLGARNTPDDIDTALRYFRDTPEPT